MSFRFIPLSTQKLPEVTGAYWSPTKPNQADQSQGSGSRPIEQLPVGLLLVYERLKQSTGQTHSNAKQLCIRQVPLFLSKDSILGVYIPTDQKIEDAIGVHHSCESPNQTQTDWATSVHFEALYPECPIQPSHLDLVRNLAGKTSNQNSTKPTTGVVSNTSQTLCFFFLSNTVVGSVMHLHDHYLGYLDEAGKKWPVFGDRGHLCLKLPALDQLTALFPVWVDSLYRIRLGKHEPKQQPTVYLTITKVALTNSNFEYPVTWAEELNSTKVRKGQALKPTEGEQLSGASISSITSGVVMASWLDAAGISFIPRASNTLNSQGQIPHNFPVMEAKPKLAIAPWLPKFVHQTMEEAQKSHMHNAEVQSWSSKSKSNDAPEVSPAATVAECKQFSVTGPPTKVIKQPSRSKPLLVVHSGSRMRVDKTRANRTDGQVKPHEPGQVESSSKEQKKKEPKKA